MHVTVTMNDKRRVLYLLTNLRFVELTYDFDRNMVSNNVQAYAGWNVGREGKREGYFSRRAGYLNISYSDGANIGFREDGNVRLRRKPSHRYGCPADVTAGYLIIP